MFLKTEEIDIEKGRSLPEGTVRVWNKQTFQKNNGTWEIINPVKNNKRGGKVWDNFKDKPYSAVSFLLKQENNSEEAINVWQRKGVKIGDKIENYNIGIIRGKVGFDIDDKGGYGLFHIRKKHLILHKDFSSVGDIINNINMAVKKGEFIVNPSNTNRRIIKYKNYRVIIAPEGDNGNWVLWTTYNVKKSNRINTRKEREEINSNIDKFKLNKGLY
jgi:hypothetical protein